MTASRCGRQTDDIRKRKNVKGYMKQEIITTVIMVEPTHLNSIIYG